MQYWLLASKLQCFTAKWFWSSTLVTPRTFSRMGNRSFSTIGPLSWNALPPALLDETTSRAVLLTRLKTFFFQWEAAAHLLISAPEKQTFLTIYMCSDPMSDKWYYLRYCMMAQFYLSRTLVNRKGLQKDFTKWLDGTDWMEQEKL